MPLNQKKKAADLINLNYRGWRPVAIIVIDVAVASLVLFSMRDDVTRLASITHVICLGSTPSLGTRKGR